MLTKSVVGLGLAASVAAAGIGIAGTTAASDYEKSMSHIQMATGAAAEQMEETRDIAKNLYGQNFGSDWQDLGSSIASVQQITGQTGDELESTTRNALLLRDAFGIEVNESARAAKTMMENFGISSEEAFNLVAQGTQKVLISLVSSSIPSMSIHCSSRRLVLMLTKCLIRWRRDLQRAHLI